MDFIGIVVIVALAVIGIIVFFVIQDNFSEPDRSNVKDEGKLRREKLLNEERRRERIDKEIALQKKKDAKKAAMKKELEVISSSAEKSATQKLHADNKITSFTVENGSGRHRGSIVINIDIEADSASRLYITKSQGAPALTAADASNMDSLGFYDCDEFQHIEYIDTEVEDRQAYNYHAFIVGYLHYEYDRPNPEKLELLLERSFDENDEMANASEERLVKEMMKINEKTEPIRLGGMCSFRHRRISVHQSETQETLLARRARIRALKEEQLAKTAKRTVGKKTAEDVMLFAKQLSDTLEENRIKDEQVSEYVQRLKVSEEDREQFEEELRRFVHSET